MTLRPNEMNDSRKIQEDFDCPDCEHPTTYEWRELHFTYGEGEIATELTVDVPMYICAACDLQFLDETGSRLRHDAVCRHLGLLSPSEIRSIRARLKLNREEFAQYTGLGVASLARWERGMGYQNQANDRYLRLLGTSYGVSQLQKLINELKRSNVSTAASENSGQGKLFRVIEPDREMQKDLLGFDLL